MCAREGANAVEREEVDRREIQVVGVRLCRTERERTERNEIGALESRARETGE